MKDNYITTKQASTLTGYTTDYVGQLARQGYIDSQKDGRKRLVSINDLFQYIQTKEHGDKSQSSSETTVVTSTKSVIKEVNEDLDDSDNPVLSPLPDIINPVVSKKIISPWTSKLSQQSPDLDQVTSQVQPSVELSNYNQNFIATPPRSVNSGPDFQFLPAVSVTASAIAVLVFIMTIGLFVDQEATMANVNMNNIDQLASVSSLGLSEKIAYKWYQTVNNIVK